MKICPQIDDHGQEQRMSILPRTAPLDIITLAQHRRAEGFAHDLIPKDHGLNHSAVSRALVLRHSSASNVLI